MIKLLAESEAQLLCGGGFLDVSILDGASFGNGNNVNLGYFPALTNQATNGGIAGSFNNNLNGNTATLPAPGAASPYSFFFGRRSRA